MNERIKLLAEQAIANVRFWNAENESYDVGHDELEKFAELIVRECIIISQVGSITETRLKQHFGVEE
jgi:alpha-L-arabinofuranosidase